jgi:hypothetical protein
MRCLYYLPIDADSEVRLHGELQGSGGLISLFADPRLTQQWLLWGVHSSVPCMHIADAACGNHPLANNSTLVSATCMRLHALHPVPLAVVCVCVPFSYRPWLLGKDCIDTVGGTLAFPWALSWSCTCQYLNLSPACASAYSQLVHAMHVRLSRPTGVLQLPQSIRSTGGEASWHPVKIVVHGQWCCLLRPEQQKAFSTVRCCCS